MRRFFSFVLLATLSAFTAPLHALSISLVDGSRTILSGADCDIATYSFGINETWNGTPLDLEVEVVDQDNNFSDGDCIGLLNGIFAVSLRDSDTGDGDDIAFVDVIMTIVDRTTRNPVLVDRITATGFDLDNSTGQTGTDDIYLTAVEAPYLSNLSDVIYSQGSFVGGHDFKFQGSAGGNCDDTTAVAVPECRAAASWVGGSSNQISGIRVRFQNDNAYGTYDPTIPGAHRLLQLSLETVHAEQVIADTSDRGDAPASYGSAVHPITSLDTLLSNGLAPDNDQAAQNSMGADADDNDAGNTGSTGIAKYDDEDSVLRNGLPLNDQTLDAGATESFSVLSFGNGYLSAWIDLNIDGDFSDVGEKILDDVQFTGTTVNTTPVTVDIPQNAAGGNTYVRFRFNNAPGLGPNGPGVDGEVEDYRVVIAAMDPTYNMVKTASPAVITAAGTITYTFTFNNTGNAVLSDLTVSDPNIDAGTLSGCPIASLPPGQSASCTATRAVSQLQIDNGAALSNTATPSGTNPLGGAAIETTNVDNTVVLSITPVNTIAVDKVQPALTDTDGSGDVSAGDTLTYTVTATNTGTATVTNLNVNDPMLTPAANSCASVAPGGTCVLTGDYIVASGDTGTALVNTATADSDQTVQVSDSETVNIPTPVLSVVKVYSTNADEDGSTDISLGDTLSYTVTATNTGTAILTNVFVEDVILSPSSTTCATLLPNATCVLTGSYSVAAPDVTAAAVDNTATADSDQTTQVSDSITVPVPQPALTLDKAAPLNADGDGSADISVGDVLSYTITATNNGASILTDVVVNDPMLTPNTITCASLALNASCVLTGSYTVDASDVAAGSISNTADATSDQTALVQDTEAVVVPAPALSIDKSAPVNADDDGSTDISAGDVLTYTVTATNTGVATLTNVVVHDPLLTPATNNCASITTNQTCVLSGTYIVTGADVVAGTISNTATADSDQTAQVSDTEVAPLPNPALSLDKSAPTSADNDGSTDISAGDILSYTITATNTGAATLTNVVVDDPMLSPGSHTCATVPVNGTCVLNGTYTVISADVVAGTIDNTATANSDQTAQIADTETVAVPAPALALSKPVPANADEDGSGDASAGDTLTYSITASNSGAAVLTNVVVSDPMTNPASISCPSIAPGGTCILIGTYSVTAADVTAGSIDNTATANSDQTASVTDSQSVALGMPALAITKPAPVNADEDGSGDVSVGDTLSYTVTATNNGAVNLTNVLVSDPMLVPASFTCGLVTPGSDCILTGNYTVTASDVASGSIDNTATADSDQTGSVSAVQTVNPPNPLHTISKPAPINADEDGSGDASAGDTLTYTITATNTGTANLTNLFVSDPNTTPASNTCALVTPGNTCVLSGDYQLTAADVTNGSVLNTASAVSDQSPSVSDSQTVTLAPPMHVLDKATPTNADEDGSTDISLGDTLTYVVTATNTGGATLTDLIVSDPMLTPGSQTCATVIPGASCVLTGTYSVTAGDVTATTIVNTASSVSDQTPQLDDAETVSVPTPGLVIAKPDPVNADEDGSGDISVGDTLSYTITATNNGTAILTNLTVSDPLITPASNTCALVAAGSDCVLAGNYTVTAADVSATTINNTATAIADQAGAVTANNTVPLLVPDLTVDKAVPVNADEDGTGDIGAGDTLTYTITATNNGAATLTNVVVSDPLINPASSTCATVLSGDTCVLSGIYIVSSADVATGQIDNTASADSDQTGPVSDTQSVPVLTPALSLIKPAPVNGDQDGSGDVSAGDVLTYTITATNTGGTTLTNVVVNDPLINPPSFSCATLLAGADCVHTGTYTVLAADVTAGSVDNTATADSDQTASVSDSENVPLGVPSHTLDKAAPTHADADGTGDISAGDTLNYTITATNNGAAILTNMIVSDPMITPNTTTCASVPVGNTCVLTGSYLVTAADVAAGSIVNTADSDTDQTGPLTDTETIALNTPGLVLDKAAPANADEDGNGEISLGDTLSYTITATNNGAANLSNVLINDSMITPSNTSCALLAVGSDCVLTGTYMVTAADVLAGTLPNTATADSDQTGQLTDTEVVALNAPSHIIDKAAPVNADEDGSTDISANDTLTYIVTATNNGSATLTNMLVSDPMLVPATATCASVLPGGICVLTGTYVVTAADVGAGVINNTATASTDQTAQLDDTESVVVPNPAMTITKSAPVNGDQDGSGDVSAGDVLSYTVTTDNTGTAILTNVLVNDPLLSPTSHACAILLPSDTCVLTGTYVVTSADIVNGMIANIADSISDQTATISDTHNLPIAQPSLMLTKAVPTNADQDGTGDISAGDVLTYTITASNNGGATLTNVVISDALINPTQHVCASVPAGATCVLVGDYTVTTADVATGVVNNTASANSDQTSVVTDSESVVVPVPLHTLFKSSPTNADDDASGDISAGDVLTYTVTATNTGTAVLTNLTIDDSMISPATTNCVSVLPGQTCVLTGSYTVTAADIVSGAITNDATSVSDQSPQADDSHTISLNSPSLAINKPAPTNADEDSSADVSAGDTLTYTITASNNGSSNLTNVVVNDPLISPATQTCNALAIGADCVLVGTYVVTSADVTAGFINNTATADSVQTGAVTDNVTVPLPSPALALDKAAPANADQDGSGDVSAGDVLTYTITATNTGSATLTNVLVSDPLVTPSSINCATLLSGAACVLVGDYTATATDVGNGSINNTASADSDQTPSISDSEVVTLATPDLTIAKALSANADEDGSGDVSAGDTLTYVITATNTGTATLTNLTVSDPLISPSSASCGSVPAGNACVLTGTYAVTMSDVASAAVDNTAIASSDQAGPASDNHSLPIPQPAMVLSKLAPTNADEDGSGDISAGDTLSYTIIATNSGTSSLTSFVVNDPLIQPASINCGTVTPGNTCTLTGIYTVATADVAAGVINNTADSDSDQTNPLTDSQSVIIPTPLHTLVKGAPANADNDGSGDISIGDVLTYTITATNTGSATLTNLTVSDPVITPATTSCALVVTGDDCILTGSYTVTAADITAGTISNTATSISDQSGQVSDTQIVSLNAPSLVIDKPAPVNGDEDASTDVSVGDTLTYTITATNNGSSNLTNVVVSDSLIVPNSATCSALPTGASCVLTGAYVVAANDVTSGTIVNTATATSDQTPSVSDDEIVPVPAPLLTVLKPAPLLSDQDGSSDISAGDVLTYTITASNAGTAVLTNVVVDDPMITPSSNVCLLLAPGADCVLSGAYSVTNADVAAATIQNTATANSDQTPSISDNETVLLATPDLTLTKAAPTNADGDFSGDVSAGDSLTYTITATNNGSATLTNVVVNDPLISPSTTTCASVIAGDSCILTGSYVVTAADVASGTLDNTATANSDQAGPASNSHNLPLLQPAMALDKAAPVNADEDGSGDISAGDTLSYTVTATNTGTATLTDLIVSDPLIAPSNTICATVAPGDSCVLTGSYSVTSADVLAGVVNNVAEANSDQTGVINDSESVVVPQPLHSLLKSPPVNTDNDNSGDISTGDVLTYTITATNTGTATLTNLSVDDALINPSTISCPLVGVGDTCVLTGTYTVTAVDINTGTISNTASSGSDQTSSMDDTQLVILNAPGLVIDKPAPVNADEDGSTDLSAGDTLTYTVTATNNGMAMLTNVLVSDPLILPTSNTCSSVAPGATCVLTGNYTVTVNDVAAGSIINTATADSDQTPSVTDDVTVVLPSPEIAIDKVLSSNADQDGSADISAGDILTYTVTATNTGNAFLTNAQVNDTMITPASQTCALIAPGATCILVGDYTVTAADVVAGLVNNTATAVADQVSQVEDVESVILQQPLLSLLKPAPAQTDSDSSGDLSAGDILTYTVTATNTGMAVLTDVIVSDPLLSPASANCNSIAAGEECVLTGTYVATAADVAAGAIVNTASAVSDQTPQVTVDQTVALAAPSLALNKAAPVNDDADGSTDVSAGDTLTYQITATNNGSAGLTNLSISDPMIVPGNIVCELVLPGESCVLTGSYTVTTADVVAGEIINSASADSDQTPAAQDTHTQNLAGPGLSLDKALSSNADEDGSTDVSAGDTLSYTITATNTGNAHLTNVVISDPLITPGSHQCDSVLPGQTCVLSGTYSVTPSDITTGSIDNTASASSDQAVSIFDTETVLVPQPAYALIKSMSSNADEDGSGDVSVGDTLTYIVTASNTGTATLTSVTINDDMVTPSTLVCTTLSPVTDCVLTGTYTVTAADLVAGVITNNATVDSDQLSAINDTITTNLDQPSLTIAKGLTANADEDGSDDVSAADTLTYTVTATNEGSSALTNVVVGDNMISPSANSCALVLPAESCVLSGTYQVTANDVINGQIVNTANANSDQTPQVSASVTNELMQPTLALVKSLVSNDDDDGTGDLSTDDTLHYSVVATNTGTAVLTNVSVVDPMLAPNAANCATLAPQGSCELTGYYIVAAADVDAGMVVNTATANSDQTAQLQASHTVDIARPVLTLVKAAPTNADNDGSGSVTLGDVLTYTVTASNEGATALSNVVVSDPMLNPPGQTCALLAVGAVCELVGEYIVAENDVGAGQIVNTATVNSDQTGAIEALQTEPVITILPPKTTDNSQAGLPLGEPVVVQVLADDSDPESNIDPATVKIIDPQSNKPVTTLLVAGEGSWSVDPVTGDITFTPEAGYVGTPTPIRYIVADTTGLVSNISRVTLTFEEPASLTGTVWMDVNRDGEIDSFEPVMPNWTLNIYNDDGVLVASTVTDENGVYGVADLVPSEYTVHFLNDAGVFMAETTTGGVLQAGQTIDLPLPIDPSGIVYDSITREPIPNVTLQLVNSAGVVIDPVCLNANQQGQTTRADGFYAFDVFPDAHSSCPLDDIYTIEIVSQPATYEGAISRNIPPEQLVFDSAGAEDGCTVDTIPDSGACEIQPQSTAPQSGDNTRYYLSFRLAAGDSNVIFNHIPIDPFIAAAMAELTLQKTAARQTVSTGDVIYYTIRLENSVPDAAMDVSVTDDLPNGFSLVPDSATVTAWDGNQKALSTARVVTTGVDPVVFTGLSVPGLDQGEISVTYAVRVGASLFQGQYTNTAVVTAGGASNTGRATVSVVADPVLDSATLIGKVFHDRDGDGYQDNAHASNITISSSYFGNSPYRAGDLQGRSDRGDKPEQLVVNVPHDINGDIVVRTAEGSMLTVRHNSEVTQSHIGKRAHGLTAQDIRVTTRVVKGVPLLAADQQSAPAGRVLEITVSNVGVNEEGIPGVRLASVTGIVVETDEAGRFHIPDVDTGSSGLGQQTIVKLDLATIPRGAVLTTENPRVLRVTNSALNTMRFGVRLPEPKKTVAHAPAARGAVSVRLGSIFFDTDKHHIRADQRGVLQDIIRHIKELGSGQILIEAHTDKRQTHAYNISLAERRARTVEAVLREALGNAVMQNVSVEVDISAFGKERKKTTRSGSSPETSK